MSTLDLILKYGLADSHDFWEFTAGLPAYDAWINAFQKRQIDAPGNSFNIQVIKNAREIAVRFLNEFKHSFNEVEQINLVEKAIIP